MRDYLTRTLVPLLVGVLIGQAARVGLELDPVATTTIVTPAVSLAYAWVVRGVEQVWPEAGRWLMSAGLATRAPVYVDRRQLR